MPAQIVQSRFQFRCSARSWQPTVGSGACQFLVAHWPFLCVCDAFPAYELDRTRHLMPRCPSALAQWLPT